MWLFYESAVSKNLSEKSSLAKPRLKKTSKKTIIAQWVEFTHKVTLAILKHLNADSISDTYQAPKQSTKIQMLSTLKVNAARFARSETFLMIFKPRLVRSITASLFTTLWKLVCICGTTGKNLEWFPPFLMMWGNGGWRGEARVFWGLKVSNHCNSTRSASHFCQLLILLRKKGAKLSVSVKSKMHF